MQYSTTLLNIIALLATLVFTCGDGADDQCTKLKDPEYELYGSKTNYDTARAYLTKDDGWFGLFNPDLPKSFDADSLEKEHKSLVGDYCKPVAFYFIGRHSARFPDAQDMILYNNQLGELKDELRRQVNSKCPEKHNEFLNWTSKLQPKYDDLITDLGAKEEREIARRFKRLYPEFFDAQRSDIKVGVSNKLRTAQTGAEFLKEVDRFRIPGCDPLSLPSNDIDKPGYSVDSILKSACYKAMMEKYNLPFLELGRNCARLGDRTKEKEPLVDKARDPLVVKDIGERISKKLGLPTEPEPAISPRMLGSILNVCKFENALKNDSIWCSLFDKKDIQSFEFVEDVSTYIKGAYGPNANANQSCSIIKDLLENFQDAQQLTGSDSEKRKAFFYFSHADPIKRLIAALGLFKDDDNSFSEKSVNEFVTKSKIPFFKDRQWRSSLIIPFSGNMAFIMYRCQKSPSKPVKHKILTTITEKPVKLAGCKETQCPSDKFFDTYSPLKECDLSRLCAWS